MNIFDESELANKSCLEIFDGLMSSANGDEELALKRADDIISNSDGYNEELTMARDALMALVKNKKSTDIKEAMSYSDIDKMTENEFLPALNEQPLYLDEDDTCPVRIFYRNYTQAENGTKDKSSPSIVAYMMVPNLPDANNGRRWKTIEKEIDLGNTYEEQLNFVKDALFNVSKNYETLNKLVFHPLGISYTDNEEDSYNEELNRVKNKNNINKNDYEEFIDKNVLTSTAYRKVIDELSDEQQEDEKFMHKIKSLISTYKYKYDMDDDSIIKMLILQKIIPLTSKNNNDIKKYANDELFKEILNDEDLIGKIR